MLKNEKEFDEDAVVEEEAIERDIEAQMIRESVAEQEALSAGIQRLIDHPYVAGEETKTIDAVFDAKPLEIIASAADRYATAFERLVNANVKLIEGQLAALLDVTTEAAQEMLETERADRKQ